MARQPQCLFCQNQADSREHLWAAWIHERIRRRPVRIDFARRPVRMSNNPEIKVRTVCETCNNGWMSDLETACIPLIGSLMQDVATPLDPAQQKLLSTWAVKTAMVLDSTNTRERKLFYTRTERENLRLSSTIPDRTKVWAGRSALDGLVAEGTDVGIESNGTNIAVGYVTTIIVGHLALQALSVHALPQHAHESIDVAPRPGPPWADLLVQIWPVSTHSVNWPPRLTFTGSGTLQHIGQLLYRYRMGRRARQPIA